MYKMYNNIQNYITSFDKTSINLSNHRTLPLYCNKVQRSDRLYRFTMIKSRRLVGFSTLPYESGNTVALWHFTTLKWYSSNVVALWHFTMAKWYHFSRLKRQRAWAHSHGHAAPGAHIRAGQAGSCELEAASW